MTSPQHPHHARHPGPSRPRIVSLVPSATEVVGLLGASDWLVGRSHECDYPPAVRSAAVLTSQTTGGGSAAEVDRQVKEQLAAGKPLYRVDEELLRTLRPDIIFTQDLCRVCSVDLPTVRRLADGMDPRPVVVSLNPTTLDGVLDDVLTVAGALGLEDTGTECVVALRERLAAAEDHVNRYEEGPNVAFLEWTDPFFVGEHWTVQMIERAGGVHPLHPTRVLPGSGEERREAGDSIQVTAEQLVASAPERVIICPCGLDLAQTRRAAAELAEKTFFKALTAGGGCRVALVDGNQMFNRPGPRLVDAFEWLVGWLHERPELIPGNFPWEPANR